MQRAKKVTQQLRPQLVVSLVTLGLVLGFLVWPSRAPASIAPPTAEAVAAVLVSAPLIQSSPAFGPTDCQVVACVALTFDDGPNAVITPRILDILKQHKAQATFFVLGAHVGGNEALLRRIHSEGHEIGNHSWNHPYLTQVSLQQVQDEVLSTQAAIANAGVPAPHLFRPPYGDINDAVAAQIPLSIVRWNIDPEDWRPKKQPYLLDHVASYVRPGSVILMHDTETTTADKLDALLVQLEGQQYTFVTISTILNLSPGQRGVYFAR
ncbi:MAG TPA: polysaccharide deacetylase family protein [Candidatus Saccharimonadales bacterium]|nr:polysaccharide deacetylase family protein [Candidatus Saccharimonadales bacterium]